MPKYAVAGLESADLVESLRGSHEGLWDSGGGFPGEGTRLVEEGGGRDGEVFGVGAW